MNQTSYSQPREILQRLVDLVAHLRMRNFVAWRMYLTVKKYSDRMYMLLVKI